MPRFREPVLNQADLASAYLDLHSSLMRGAPALEREEQFLVFLERLFTVHADLSGNSPSASTRRDIEDVCAYLESHYAERITLEQLAAVAKLNKYTLIRAFTRFKGITPYRYLETIRINRAKTLLEQGIEPAEAAQRTGFSDQSHFTSYFGRFIGLTPGQYRSVFRENMPE